MNKNVRTTSYFAALAASAALAVAACTPTPPQSDGTPTLPPPPAPTEEVITDPAPDPTALEPQSAPLGVTATTSKGLDITVTPAGTGVQQYTGTAYQNYTVAVTNGTDTQFDPALVSMVVNYGPEGIPASQVFDYQNNATPYFQGIILPGGTQTVTQSYSVPEGQPVVITVTPSWDDSPVTFIG